MRRSGFTLVELLVVIAVIAVLTGLALPAISAVRTRSQVRETEATLDRIKLALATYQNDFGDYPPSIGRPLGLQLNGSNDGAELMLRCLSTRARSGPYLQLDDRMLGNTDGDRLRSGADPTRSSFGTPDLLEPLDSWQNPIVYIHNTQYDAGGNAVLREGGLAAVPASKSPETKQYHGLTTFQLWSAGPDGQAGTDDDIRRWGE